MPEGELAESSVAVARNDRAGLKRIPEALATLLMRQIKTKKLHHGTLNAVILPHVLRFNEPNCYDKYAKIRIAMGLGEQADLANEIEILNRNLGLPADLTEMGVTFEDCTNLIDWAFDDHSTATNGRPVAKSDFRQLFSASLGRPSSQPNKA